MSFRSGAAFPKKSNPAKGKVHRSLTETTDFKSKPSRPWSSPDAYGAAALERAGLRDHPDNPAAQRPHAADLDLGALQRVQQVDGGVQRLARERQLAERLGQGLAARQLDGADAALVVEVLFKTSST